jgi:hypothetical protein
MKTNIHISLSFSWNEKTKVSDKIETHNLCSVTLFFFFRKSFRLWNIEKKYCRAGQALDDDMAPVLTMLDTQGYKHTL